MENPSSASEPFVVVVPGPRMRLEDNDQFKARLYQLVAEGRTRLVLDMSGVEFVDSSFLGLLIIVLKRVSALGGDLRVSGLCVQVREIFALMRLDKLFHIHDTTEEAVRSFA